MKIRESTKAECTHRGEGQGRTTRIKEAKKESRAKLATLYKVLCPRVLGLV